MLFLVKHKNYCHISTNTDSRDAYIEEYTGCMVFKYDSDQFSNFYVKLQGKIFKSGEHAYQWIKASSLGHAACRDSKQIVEALNQTGQLNYLQLNLC